MALAKLVEKGADVEVLCQISQFMAQRLIEIDGEGRCGTGYDENVLGLSGVSKSEVSRLCSAEQRVHLGPSGLWTYATRWDTISPDVWRGRPGSICNTDEHGAGGRSTSDPVWLQGLRGLVQSLRVHVPRPILAKYRYNA